MANRSEVPDIFDIRLTLNCTEMRMRELFNHLDVWFSSPHDSAVH